MLARCLGDRHRAIVAALLARFGPRELDRIESGVAEASLRAIERWPQSGVPSDPEGWLVRTAHNAIVDELRRDARLTAWSPAAHDRIASAPTTVDDELAVAFLCAHPSLPRAAQIALTLKIAFGLSVPAIARAFLADERAIAQRIVRSKQKLRDENVRFELPDESELPTRLDAILDVLHVALAEAQAPTEGAIAVDAELAGDALRLARLLAESRRTSSPTVHAFHAIACFHVARAPARLADDGSLLLLPEQDRTRWDRDRIAEGFAALERAGRGDRITRFHLEAGIAATHAAATSFASTEWSQIAELYDALFALVPSPVVAVGRAFAIAMCHGAEAGIAALDAIDDRDVVERYPYALAAYADLHASAGRLDRARDYLDRALRFQTAAPERALLLRKRAGLG